MDYVNNIIKNMAVTYRNRDLDQPLTQDQVKYFANLAAQTPTKQSNRYFDVLAVTNIPLIKNIFHHTKTPTVSKTKEKLQLCNSQVVAPLLLLYLKVDVKCGDISKEYEQLADWDEVKTDTDQAIGISAGVVSYEANRKGLVTGYCRCYDDGAIKAELSNYGLDSEEILKIGLLLSIGKPMFDDPRRHQYFDISYQPHHRIDPKIHYIK